MCSPSLFSVLFVFSLLFRPFPQSFWITRLDTFTDFLAFRAKLPKPAVQELKSPCCLPSPFFPPVAARPLLHCPAQSAPASPAASALRAHRSHHLWKVFVPWSAPKSASGPSFTLCPSSPHPQLRRGLFSFVIALKWSLTQLPQITPPLPKLSSLQVLVLLGALTSSGCCAALAESFFSPSPLTVLPSYC